jgi:hypothetical protein
MGEISFQARFLGIGEDVAAALAVPLKAYVEAAAEGGLNLESLAALVVA